MVEYEINLSVIARFRIMDILNKQKGRVKDIRDAANLYDKIEIPDEEREKRYMKKDRNGDLVPDNEAIRDAPYKKFILDYKELAALDKFLTEAEIAPAEPRLWYDYVIQQLENARKPALDDTETKTERLAKRGANSSKGISAS